MRFSMLRQQNYQLADDTHTRNSDPLLFIECFHLFDPLVNRSFDRLEDVVNVAPPFGTSACSNLLD